jgi:hypothetical protein
MSDRAKRSFRSNGISRLIRNEMTVSALRRLEGMRFPGYPARGASKIVHDRPPRSGDPTVKSPRAQNCSQTTSGTV